MDLLCLVLVQLLLCSSDSGFIEDLCLYFRFTLDHKFLSDSYEPHCYFCLNH